MNKLLGIAWENIFVGLVGALIVGAVTYIFKIVKEKITEKKFPLAGEYITKFEDEINCVKIESTAPAILKQKGKKITGLTYMPKDDRRWLIEGEISANGHIYGIYYAEDPIDKGIGNFFLKVDNKRNMYGLWSGYDSVNGKITSGKYIFHPVYKSVEIIDLKKEYFPQLLDISDKELGKDYLSYDDLEKVLNCEEEYICKLAMNKEDGRIIGFCLCLIITPDSLQTILKLNENQIPRALKHSEKVGVLKTTAVEKKYQGYGIGRKLTETCYTALLKRKVQSVCSVGWKNGDKVNINGILTSLGFVKYIEMENYWESDSLEKGYSCPACGKPPCKCSAVIYTQSVFES